MSKCNYHASLEGLVVSANIRQVLRRKSNYGHWAWLGYEIFVNAVDDAWVIYSSAYSFYLHWDLFNLSVIVGKIIKIAFQLYLEGLFR